LPEHRGGNVFISPHGKFVIATSVTTSHGFETKRVSRAFDLAGNDIQIFPIGHFIFGDNDNICLQKSLNQLRFIELGNGNIIWEKTLPKEVYEVDVSKNGEIISVLCGNWSISHFSEPELYMFDRNGRTLLNQTLNDFKLKTFGERIDYITIPEDGNSISILFKDRIKTFKIIK